MQSKAILGVAIFMAAANPTNALARTCNGQDHDQARHVVRSFVPKIVEEHGGGQMHNSRILSCFYNEYSRELEVEVEITYKGLFNTRNHYELRGDLLRSSNGRTTFSVTYRNEKLRVLMRNLAILGFSLFLLEEGSQGR